MNNTVLNNESNKEATSLVIINSSFSNNNNQQSSLQNIKKQHQRKTLWDQKKKLPNHISPHTITSSTKWGNQSEKNFTPLPFSHFPPKASQDEIEIILRRSRLDEIERILANNNWETLDNDLRSPSPPPVYDVKRNIRINTFDNRNKEKYLKEKNSLIEDLLDLDKSFKPPLGWKRPMKTYILYYNNTNECNLTSLLIGPKGITHKELEKKTKCKISIRGDCNSNTNANNKNNGFGVTALSLSPHLIIQSHSQELIDKAKEYLSSIINTSSQEHFSFRKIQQQLTNKQFGLKGTERDVGCENCGEKGHSTWACPLGLEANISKIECGICGDKGHLTIDCKKIDDDGDIVVVDEKDRDFEEFMKKLNTDSLEDDYNIDLNGKIKDKANDDIYLNSNAEDNYKNDDSKYNTKGDIGVNFLMKKRAWEKVSVVNEMNKEVINFNFSNDTESNTEQYGNNNNENYLKKEIKEDDVSNDISAHINSVKDVSNINILEEKNVIKEGDDCKASIKTVANLSSSDKNNIITEKEIEDKIKSPVSNNTNKSINTNTNNAKNITMTTMPITSITLNSDLLNNNAYPNSNTTKINTNTNLPLNYQNPIPLNPLLINPINPMMMRMPMPNNFNPMMINNTHIPNPYNMNQNMYFNNRMMMAQPRFNNMYMTNPNMHNTHNIHYNPHNNINFTNNLMNSSFVFNQGQAFPSYNNNNNCNSTFTIQSNNSNSKKIENNINNNINTSSNDVNSTSKK